MRIEDILTSWSIQKKLQVLLLVVFLPACGIIIWSGLDHREHAIGEAGKNASLVVQSLAAMQTQTATGTKQMLSTLAQLPEVQRLDAEACNELFREVRDRNQSYATILATTVDGTVFAASRPFEPGINLLDRKYVKEAIDNLDFSVGEYTVGRITKVPVLSYAYPVLDANRNLIAAVIASFRLDEFADFIKKANLPEGSSLIIADHVGARLFRWPESVAVPLGEPIPADVLNRVSRNFGQGAYEKLGVDGIFRLYAFKQLRLSDKQLPYLYILIGFPKNAILHTANLEMLRNLSILGVAALIAVCLTWVFGNVAFIRPINRLVTATRRFGKGETGVRTELPHTPDEMGELAESFDGMASLLEVRDIERRQAEQALRDSELRLRTILQTANEGFWLIDNDTVAKDLNPRMCKILGRNREEIIGRKIFDFVDNENRAIFEQQVRLRAQGQLGAYEIALSRPDGSHVFCQFNVTPLLDESGKKVGAFAMVTDISERKQAEEDKARLAAIVESSDDAIISKALDGTILTWNRGAEKIYGYAAQDAIGKSISFLIPDDQSDELTAILDRIRCGENIEHYETIRQRRDGQHIHVSLTISPIFDTSGRTIGASTIARDITGRRLAEEAIRQQLNFQQILIDTIPSPIFYKDTEGRYLGCNSSFESFIGMSKADIIGKMVHEIAPEDLADIYRRADLALFYEPGVQQYETRVRYSDGARRDVFFTKGTFTDLEGKVAGLVGVMLDITELKRTERELSRYRDHLEDLVRERTAELAKSNERLTIEIKERRRAEDALKMFAYSVAHDLKSPSIGIYGLTKRLHKLYGGVLDEKGRTYCDQILKVSEHIAALVEQVNVFIATKEVTPLFEDTNISDVLRILKNEFSAQLSIRRIEWIEPETEVGIKADRLSLLRVFRNLIDNAMKYGGDRLSKIWIGHKDTQDFHIFSVTDDGKGLKGVDSEKIFRMFQRHETSKGVEGSGLGLAIVKEIAQKHGGQVWVEPGPKKGTTFCISISKNL